MVEKRRRSNNILMLTTLLLLLLVLCQLTTGWVLHSPPTQHRRRHSTTSIHRTTASDDETTTTFPLSIRPLLLDRHEKLLASSGGTYSSAGWSNRVGSVLTPVSPQVYTGDRPFYWNRIDVGCRMTVIQLPNDDLWIHSPIGLDRPLQEALDTLGTVKYVVSPNYEHLKYAPEWHAAYPNAQMWGCPGLTERMPDINFAGEIPHGMRPSTNTKMDWDASSTDEIIPLHLNVEVNPFTGRPFFNEVIFFHAPSKTLLTTDLYWNYPQPNGIPNSHLVESKNESATSSSSNSNPNGAWELAPVVGTIPIGSRLWKIGMDQLFLPFYKRFMVQGDERKRTYEEICDIILNEWEVETVIPAHGDILRGKQVIREVLQKHLLQ